MFVTVRELLAVHGCLKSIENREIGKLTAYWLYMRAAATKRTLMNYFAQARLNIALEPDSMIGSLAVVTCNAVTCFVNMAFAVEPWGTMQRVGHFALYLPSLKLIVAQHPLKSQWSRNGCELRLWLLFIGMFSEHCFEGAAVEGNNIAWLQVRFRQTLAWLDVASRGDAKVILQQYLYRPKLMDWILGRLLE